jgi:hypothetical protein
VEKLPDKKKVKKQSTEQTDALKLKLKKASKQKVKKK